MAPLLHRAAIIISWSSTEQTKPDKIKANIHPEHKILQHKTNAISKARFGRLIRPPAWKRSRSYSTAPGATRGTARLNYGGVPSVAPGAWTMISILFNHEINQELHINMRSLHSKELESPHSRSHRPI